MATKTTQQKTECINPNSGRSIMIDKTTYDLFSKAIYYTLKKNATPTYTQIVEGVEDCFNQQKTKFDGSIGWYAVTVKKDMEARGLIEVFTEGRKKLHRIKK